MLSVNLINPTISVGSVNSTQNVSGSSNQLGESAFLKLLVTQLQNQDPLNPMDNTQFVSQLAQFTALEQTTNLANAFTQFQNNFSNFVQLQSASLIGKTVSTQNNTVDVIAGQPGQIGFNLPSNAYVTLKITDSNGNTINTIKLGQMSAGMHTYQWNGLNSNGIQVQDGAYTYQIQALESDGTQLLLSGTNSGVVQSVQIENGQVYVVVNGTTYPVSQITQISSGSATSNTGVIL
ncbi:flagellar hook assembly protein FlgD [Athalassotoga saccharophila]|uniref:flagellar hook assembly protein FlgD n=1 Tax=Athalassotoga saccharophila TaxID=1441386 RepID=UPI00137B8821|nr:flagellar hook capping FlgD N-terminal domain-containing protein [Athalassotoga saccharophila]BBJ27558.1 flagellar basal-body rod modification protein FlgD [Athalassotoga saccharophila]